MIPAVSAAEMAEVDRLAIADFGITLLQMMEQAGSHLAEVIRLELGGDLAGQSIAVVVGPGNNGGGGLVAARHLRNRGARVRIVLARPALRMSKAAQHQLATLIAMDMRCCVATYDLTDDDLIGDLEHCDLVVDALLGCNANGSPRGEVERLVGFIGRSGRPVVSLDVPTGLGPDTGVADGAALVAQATMTLALPKVGLTTEAAAPRVGRLYLADIGLPTALYRRLGMEVATIFAASRIVALDTTR